ncbi:putative LRR receptor-like serine/threonine-protein kinase [Cinnamomum micranthum f. kanehirae]|uniref:Putative LRR receptor-like serine/threonine-protein kinase n=1 Tax=Cinnamomum micranthum f. kanehirae TaxID=337451 RepID=A0A3S4P1N4_9MAGN|nr:putative LRR receptor-like serine/threonine-protein kinase [Cinnamomum micranthum f. kanehirae]
MKAPFPSSVAQNNTKQRNQPEDCWAGGLLAGRGSGRVEARAMGEEGGLAGIKRDGERNHTLACCSCKKKTIPKKGFARRRRLRRLVWLAAVASRRRFDRGFQLLQLQEEQEYGMGGEASIFGDIYSYGILLLEIFIGKKPTGEIFNESLSLH